MLDLFLISRILTFLISIVGVCLIVWIYFSNPKNKTNQFFALMTFLLLLWVIFGYLSHLPSQVYYALLWKRLIFAAVSLFFVFSYFFSIYFPQKGKRSPVWNKIIILLGIISCFFSVFTNLIIKDVRFREWGVDVILGKGIYVFYAVIIFFTFFILFNLFKKYFIIPPQEKIKVQYFLIGVAIFAFLNLVFNIITPTILGTFKYTQFGDYSTIFFFGFTAYAIVKRELFGIKVVLTGLLVGMIAVLLGVDALIFTEKLFFQVIKAGILIVFLFFGYLLVKSVIKEIKQREKIEEMAKQIQQAYETEKRAHKIEKAAREELERLDKAKDQFLLATQHHMRTPLTSIRGFINMLLEGSFGRLKPEVKRVLTISYDSIVRSIKLVNELLDVSQFQLGKEVIRIEPNVKITSILKEIVEELSFEVKEKGIYLKLNRSKKDLPSIGADQQRLKVALTNIIDNGVKYTKKGGVTVSAELTDSRILIIVKDTGMGVPKKEIPFLFTRTFERGESAKKAYGPGKGIGLYLAAQIIKAHQGRIWAESEGENKGSAFYMELPI